jgi:hypothetical protein
MTRTRSTLAFAFLLIALVTAGCYYDKAEVLYPQASAACDTTAVTFSRSVAPLLAMQCSGCHSNANAAAFGDNIRLENHADIVARLAKVLGAVQWLNGYSPMPKNGAMLSDCQIRMLQLWANNGALNN